jgi:putative membrane protein
MVAPVGLSHTGESVDRGPTSMAAARAVPLALAGAVVALQIAYPLVAQGQSRDRLTVLIVVCFAAASLAHALVWRGAAFTLTLFATTALGGLAVEAVGVTTGFPFGEYRYLDSLGVQVLGVPLVVALAWTMMAYPAYVVSEVIGGGIVRTALVGGWALASWDLFLDPQMVQAGHWEWQSAAPALAGIPVTNYLAWFVVAVVMMATLRTVAPAEAAVVDDRMPLALYGWTYVSSVMAHALFFGLPTSALVGGLGMGVVVAALVRALR